MKSFIHSQHLSEVSFVNSISKMIGLVVLLAAVVLLPSVSYAATPFEDDENISDINLNLSGRVMSADGPLVGATVYLKGTQTGVTTDVNGNFVFPQPLKVGDILEVSFLGYETKELVVSDDTPIELDIILDLKNIYISGAPATSFEPYKRPSYISRLWGSVKSVF